MMETGPIERELFDHFSDTEYLNVTISFCLLGSQNGFRADVVLSDHALRNSERSCIDLIDSSPHEKETHGHSDLIARLSDDISAKGASSK